MCQGPGLEKPFRQSGSSKESSMTGTLWARAGAGQMGLLGPRRQHREQPPRACTLELARGEFKSRLHQLLAV